MRTHWGQTAKVKFNGADIVNNYGGLRILGADARFEDENGNFALRNFAFNGAGAQFRVGRGAPALTLSTDFQNAGHFVVRPGGTATFSNGFATMEDDGDDGLVESLGTDNGPRVGNGALIVTGAFGNQNAAGKLSGKFELFSYGGATATFAIQRRQHRGLRWTGVVAARTRRAHHRSVWPGCAA